MKIAQRILQTLALAAAISTVALADTLPRDLAATFATMEKTIKTLDIKAFSAIFDPNFVITNPMGQSASKREFLAGIEPMFKSSQSAKHTVVVKDVAVLGDYVEVRFDMVVVLKGKSGTMKVHEVGSDSWHKVNGKWLLYRTVQDKFSMSGPGTH